LTPLGRELFTTENPTGGGDQHRGEGDDDHFSAA
jgi:hypothetical protein